MELESAVRRFDTLRGLGPCRREEERVPFYAQVYVLPLDGRRPAFWAQSADIAERGLFITTSEQLPIDAFTVLKLRTSAGELRITGRVVHRIDALGFGCEFVDLDASQREALAFLVALGRFHAHRDRAHEQRESSH
jgi:hypothetical protein